MKWEFNLSNGAGNRTMKAEVLFVTFQIERIKVSGDGILIVLQSNRPLLEAIGLERPINWKMIEGNLKDEYALNRIKSEVEKYLTHH